MLTNPRWLMESIYTQGDNPPIDIQTQVMRFDKRLFFPALLFASNLGAVFACILAGDWRRAAYWAASSVCIACVSL